MTTYPEPILLETVQLPRFPCCALPGFLGPQVEAVAEHTETPAELAAVNGLATTAASVQGKYVVEIKPGYREHLALYTAAVLPSGNRKTAALNLMTGPLQQWEMIKARDVAKEIACIEAENARIEARIKSLRSQKANRNSEDTEKEVGQLMASIRRIPFTHRVWTQDITPEQLPQLMARNAERMAIISDEGGIFDLIAGRYSGGIPNMDVFLQAHSGTPVRIDRVSRSSICMSRPLLTIALSPQPQVFQDLAKKPQFRGRGLLARFVYTFPESPLGYRTFEGRAIPSAVRVRYEKGIHALLNIKTLKAPLLIRLSPEASNDWHEFALIIERQMRPGEILSHITDWAGKLPGTAARIAGLLHCIEHAHGLPSTHEISLMTMNQALAISAVLRSHALAVFDLMGADLALHAARKIAQWIKTKQQKEFTSRECFQDLKGHFPRMGELRSGLMMLQERHYIFRAPQIGGKGVGRPSERFIVNPVLKEEWP
jgi:hypothetical protein